MTPNDDMPKSEEEWKGKLTPEQYHVLREKGTERPFAGAYVNTKQKGMYLCSGCGVKLFSSDAKFDSGSGWPSFFKPIEAGSVDLEPDYTLGMARTEVVCSNCGGHLGHVFDDGPKEETGKRFCINSLALKLEPMPDDGMEKK